MVVRVIGGEPSVGPGHINDQEVRQRSKSEAPAPVQQDVPQPAPANNAPAVEPTPRSDREDYGEVVELRATCQKPLFQSELAFLPRAL